MPEERKGLQPGLAPAAHVEDELVARALGVGARLRADDGDAGDGADAAAFVLELDLGAPAVRLGGATVRAFVIGVVDYDAGLGGGQFGLYARGPMTLTVWLARTRVLYLEFCRTSLPSLLNSWEVNSP